VHGLSLGEKYLEPVLRGLGLWVHCEGSRDGYRDMERFIGTVRDPGRADRLEIAISGRGAFRRFKDILGP
jgi:hypothetical protein